MSEQGEALIKMAVDKKIIEPPPPHAGEAGGRVADLLDPNLPKIQIPGEYHVLSQFAREIGAVVRKDFIYRRDRTPVTINLEKSRLDKIANAHAFRSKVEKKLLCYKEKVFREGVGIVIQTMPVEAAQGCLIADEFIDQLPEIERANSVRLPVMRRPAKPGEPGKLELLAEGYDADSKTFTFPSQVVYDETMTLDQGVGILTSLTSEFPFGDWPAPTADGLAGAAMHSRSQAVVIAGMLSLFGAALLPEGARRPVFVYNANSSQSGKTLLAKLAVIPVFGKMKTQSWSKRDEEMRKVLDTQVLSGGQYLVFDNVRGHMASDSFEAFVTAPEWGGRLLGGNEDFSMPNHSGVYVSGNDLTLNADISNRSLLVDLFLEDADVQERRIGRLINDAWLKDEKNRSMVLSAMWALVRAWDAAGRPSHAKRMSSFETWAAMFGGIVQHANLGDCITRGEIDGAGDTEMQDMRELVLALSKLPQVADEGFEFHAIVKECVKLGLFDWIFVDDDLGPKEKSRFGKLLNRWCSRTFTYSADLRIKFGNRGAASRPALQGAAGGGVMIRRVFE